MEETVLRRTGSHLRLPLLGPTGRQAEMQGRAEPVLLPLLPLAAAANLQQAHTWAPSQFWLPQ